jgi:RepB DNA-primase from phage plasmid/Primase C terminal 2 (PriCT-2)
MSPRPVDTTHKSQSNVVAPLHDKGMAAEFLAVLDPAATKFTFQFFSDSGGGYPEVFHGSLEDVWPKVEALNNPATGMGVFVTINETDLQGRKSENIVRPRALFADADNADQFNHALDVLRKTGAKPTMAVPTSQNRAHFYFCCDDIPLERFSECQTALAEKLGTDPAIKDLPRVMRLPGTLHLKDPNKPQKVVLKRATKPRRWKIGEVVKALGLQPSKSAAQGTTSNAAPVQGITCKVMFPAEIFTAADAERLRRKFASVSGNDLSAGIETNIEEIKSAVAAIPPAAITTEGEWVKLARGLAHEARVYAGQAEELWEILETASRAAPGYDQAENRSRWLRYIAEALDRENPITIATPLDMAKKHGWKGWSPPAPALVTSSSPAPGPTASPTSGLTVSFANIPHRRWQYGIDLLRGEITLLAAPGGVGKFVARHRRVRGNRHGEAAAGREGVGGRAQVSVLQRRRQWHRDATAHLRLLS